MKIDVINNIKLPKFWFVTGVVLSLTGIVAIVLRFYYGLQITNLTQNIPWGFWVAFYIYFIGLSAGSFLISTLIYVFRIEKFAPVGRLALIQALICMGMAMWLIIVDLGHPERIYNIIISWNPTSVLAWEAMFYGLYITIIIAEIYYAMKPDFYLRKHGKPMPEETLKKFGKWLFILGLCGIPVAIGVHGGTGALFAVAKARPNWFSGLFPIIFLVSALASGGGLLTFLTGLIFKDDEQKKKELLKSLLMLTTGVIMFDMLLFASEILVTFYGGMPHEVEGWRLTMFGPYWYAFWFVQVGLGMVVPIYINFNNKLNNSVKWLTLAGLAVVIGIIGTRLNIVIPPQISPQFEALPEANHHFRFSYGYFASLNEILLTVGSIAIGVWAVIFALRYLPYQSKSKH
jgi:molybdopterin-containing oxidoreductase family membrane subunit